MRDLVFYPDYSGGNPYQRLIYSPLVSSGWSVTAGDIEVALAKTAAGEPCVFHMHWLNALFKDAQTDEQAWLIVNRFISQAGRLQRNGGKLMWTIHNHSAHENKFAEQDLRLRHYLCATADKVHLHCFTHFKELHNLPLDPARTVVMRHGNYIGAYGGFDLALRLQTLGRERLKLLFLGMIRQYKGTETLLRIISECVDRGLNVTIAGSPETPELKQQLEDFCARKKVASILRRLSEAEVHRLCLEHNVGIVSYDRILTSGTLKLYQSYAMVMLAPGLNAVSVEDRYGTFIYTTEPEGSPSRAVETLISLSDEQLRERAKSNYFAAQECGWSADIFNNI